MYITFGGLQVQSILTTLGLHFSTLYSWEDCSPLGKIVEQILLKVKKMIRISPGWTVLLNCTNF